MTDTFEEVGEFPKKEGGKIQVAAMDDPHLRDAGTEKEVAVGPNPR